MKRFIAKALIYFIPFCCIYFGYKILLRSFTGNLGILAQMPIGKNYDRFLKKNYLSENLTIDTLVVSSDKLQIPNASKIFTHGDSFSDQGIIGYQNYLSHFINDRVVNIKYTYGGENQINTALSLLNSGVIDSTNCSVYIMQVVGVNLIRRLNRIDFDVLYEFPEIEDDSQINEGIRNDTELYNLCSFIRLRLNYQNPANIQVLKDDFFTHRRYSRKLITYFSDMSFVRIEESAIETAKENLILLKEKFTEKGIKFIFLIATDKYDVYRPFLADDSLPVNTVTDGFNTTNIPDVYIINPKSTFQEMIHNGQKDLYMVHDSHWSYIASEVIARKLYDIIDIQ